MVYQFNMLYDINKFCVVVNILGVCYSSYIPKKTSS